MTLSSSVNDFCLVLLLIAWVVLLEGPSRRWREERVRDVIGGTGEQHGVVTYILWLSYGSPSEKGTLLAKQGWG